jgi:hypothetical protein
MKDFGKFRNKILCKFYSRNNVRKGRIARMRKGEMQVTCIHLHSAHFIIRGLYEDNIKMYLK